MLFTRAQSKSDKPAMESTTDQLVYLPLEASQIRLLTLHPGNSQDSLHCSLAHVTLHIESTNEILRKLNEGLRGVVVDHDNTAPVYEALSYMWGPDEIYDSIRVNDCDYAVRRNLWYALHYLRQLDKPRTLWIDAICIDQSNIPERGMQVSIMASIYWRASQVLVWLGESAEGSDDAMRSISAGDRIPFKDDHDVWKRHLKQNSKDISSLAMRPYWKRLWIIQEVFMAGSLRIYCGSESTLWDNFVKACRLLGLSLAETWRTTSKTNAGNIIDLRSPHLRSFEILLDIARVFECADSRDKIYGLLGLAADPILRSLKPDYSKNTAQLYTEIMELVTSPGYISPIPFALDVMACSWRLQRVLEQPFWDPVSKEYKQIDCLEMRDTYEVTLHEFNQISLAGHTIFTLYREDAEVDEWMLFEEAMLEVIGYFRGCDHVLNHEDALHEKCKELVANPQNLQRIVDITKIPYAPRKFRFFVTSGGDVGIAPYTARKGDTACVISNGVDCTDLIILRTNQEKATEPLLVGRASMPLYKGRLIGSGKCTQKLRSSRHTEAVLRVN